MIKQQMLQNPQTQACALEETKVGSTKPSETLREEKSRKKSSRSCDACRLKKVRCVFPTGTGDVVGAVHDGHKCQHCVKHALACTFNRVPLKRGPGAPPPPPPSPTTKTSTTTKTSKTTKKQKRKKQGPAGETSKKKKKQSPDPAQLAQISANTLLAMNTKFPGVSSGVALPPLSSFQDALHPPASPSASSAASPRNSFTAAQTQTQTQTQTHQSPSHAGLGQFSKVPYRRRESIASLTSEFSSSPGGPTRAEVSALSGTPPQRHASVSSPGMLLHNMLYSQAPPVPPPSLPNVRPPSTSGVSGMPSLLPTNHVLQSFLEQQQQQQHTTHPVGNPTYSMFNSNIFNTDSATTTGSTTHGSTSDHSEINATLKVFVNMMENISKNMHKMETRLENMEKKLNASLEWRDRTTSGTTIGTTAGSANDNTTSTSTSTSTTTNTNPTTSTTNTNPSSSTPSLSPLHTDTV